MKGYGEGEVCACCKENKIFGVKFGWVCKRESMPNDFRDDYIVTGQECNRNCEDRFPQYPTPKCIRKASDDSSSDSSSDTISSDVGKGGQTW